eukprot:1984838-Amphidinium_carterae.1
MGVLAKQGIMHTYPTHLFLSHLTSRLSWGFQKWRADMRSSGNECYAACYATRSASQVPDKYRSIYGRVYRRSD